MRKLFIGIFVMFTFFSLLFLPSANAKELTAVNLNQSELDAFSKQIGFMLARRQYDGAAPLGLIGFNLGVEVNMVQLDLESIWDKAYTSLSAPSYLPVPVAHFKKGLPFNIDLGIRGGLIPGINLTLLGGEIRYAPLPGSVATPAVNVFLSYSILNGAKDFDLNSLSVGGSVSKGFAILTPYAGISYDQTNLDVGSSINLNNASEGVLREFIGLKINLLALKLCGEINFGEMQSYGLSLDLGF